MGEEIYFSLLSGKEKFLCVHVFMLCIDGDDDDDDVDKKGMTKGWKRKRKEDVN